MSSVTTAAAPSSHARAAVAALFLTNGAIFFTVVPRYPRIKADLGISNAALGAAIAAMPAGALIAGLLAGPVIRRFRSSRAAAGGIVLTTIAILGIALAPNAYVLGAALFVVGALDSVVDVAQNTHGLRVQRLYGRSIVNSLHGVWSIGAVLGGLTGAAAAGWRLPLPAHLILSAALFSAVALAAYRFLLPGPDAAAPPGTSTAPGRTGRARSAAGTVRMLALLGVLAACGVLVEDTGASWGALYLTGELGAGAATGGLAVVALQTAMTVGRLTGDRAVDRFGQRTVARTGGVLAAAGMTAAIALPTVPTALGGFALAGLGVATLVPAAMHTADELPGLSPSTGLTVVSWLLRGGFLLAPPLIGHLADLFGLRAGLLTVVAAAVVIVVLARVLVQRTRP